jgi:EcsC protein family
MPQDCQYRRQSGYPGKKALICEIDLLLEMRVSRILAWMSFSRMLWKGCIFMSTSANPGDQQLSSSGSGGSALAALPAELESILKPGKTPDRIQHAINWASRRDPAVLNKHKALKHKVTTFEDIRSLPLDQLDRVAKHFARIFRERAFVTGAITGLPGGLWALVAAGADVQLTAIYAVRMAADVAQAYGYDTTDVNEQAHLAEVLALAAGVDSLRGVGNWLSREGLAHVLPELLPRLLMRLSVELTEEQTARLVGRLIPGVGAAVAGAIDYTFLRVAGERAVSYYHNRYLIDHGLQPENPELSLPARAFSVFTPDEPQLLPAAEHQPNVVDSQVALPASLASAALPAPVVSAAAGAPVAPSAPAAPKTVKKMPKNPPERRLRFWLTVFGIFFFFVTVAACAALLVLLGDGIQHLMH